MYHEECTRGPGYTPPTYGPNPAMHWLGTLPVPALTEERVRQIAREEIAARLRGIDLTGNFRAQRISVWNLSHDR